MCPIACAPTKRRRSTTKLLQASDLSKAPCAPGTLDMLSRFCVLSRLKPHENSNLFSKMRVYNGENLKDVDPKAKSMQEYRDMAGMDEGMNGVSTRFAFKVLAETFNFDNEEVAADPVHLMYVLEQSIRRACSIPRRWRSSTSSSSRASWRPATPSSSATRSRRPIWKAMATTARTCSTAMSPMPTPGSRIRTSRTSDTGELFDRKTAGPGAVQDRESRPGIANPKDFRNEVVKFALRARAAQRRQATPPGPPTRRSAR